MTPTPGAGQPLVATTTWVQVVTTAGRRCECTGTCGRKHTTGKDRRPTVGGRCATNAYEAPVARLYAAPADPAVPAGEAWRLAPSDLAAWCGPCLDGARRKHKRPAAPEATDALFALPGEAA